MVDRALTTGGLVNVDRSLIVAKDEEEMEDFHDYEDEEQADLDSKLDEYEARKTKRKKTK